MAQTKTEDVDLLADFNKTGFGEFYLMPGTVVQIEGVSVKLAEKVRIEGDIVELLQRIRPERRYTVTQPPVPLAKESR